ncbi:MAG: hypothetical protein JNM94_14145 [Phycisphaerae bacterium]|nr:hypothetical protein [Phycisphaerae bacterium]
MLDYSPPILALLVAAATAMLALGLLGRRDRARPTCRACGRDARLAVHGSVARCACGADLYARRAVRWSRRRRSALLVAGVILAVASAAFGWLALHVRSNGPSWCIVLPAPLYEMALRHQWEGPASHSVALVMAKTQDKATRERFTDAVVASWKGTQGPLPTEALSTLGAAVRGGLPHEEGNALVDLLARSFSMDAAPNAPDGKPALRVARTDITSRLRGVLVRIDRVRLGERDLAWSAGASAGTSAGTDPGAPLWHQPGPNGIAIRLPAEVDLSSDAVRRDLAVDATLAIVPFGRFDADSDPSIAAAPDPATWAVDVTHAPFTMRGITAFTASPSVPASWSELERFAYERWQGGLGPPSAPSVAAIPLLEAAVLGLALGLAIGVAAAIARLVRAPRCSLGAPQCIGCASTLAPGPPLPPRCSECGRTVAGIDDAAWTGLGSRLRHVAAWVLALALIAAAAYGLERRAAVPLRRFLAATVATPEREVRWLVRETIAMRPYGIGPSPSNRLSDGVLESQQARLDASPKLLRVAAEEIARWAEAGGTLPPSTFDPTEVVRRAALERILVNAIQARDDRGVPSVTPEAVAKALPHLVDPDARARAPSVVRQGAAIEATPAPWERVQTERFPRDYLCEPRQSSAIGPATVRVQTIVRSGLSATPLLELASDEPVLVVAADAVHLPPEFVSGDIARRAPLLLSLEEGGTRDGVILGNFLAGGILWVGRWEVLGSDGAVVGTFETSPQGGEAAGLASLPEPWPETLSLRFTPATTWRNGQPLPPHPHGVYWTGAVRFTFTAEGEDRRMQSKMGRYRLTDATLE